jgi:hypothetical protein
MNDQEDSSNVVHEKRAMSVPHFAARYDVSSRFIAGLVSRGVLPVLRLGRKCVRVKLPEADIALAEFQSRETTEA